VTMRRIGVATAFPLSTLLLARRAFFAPAPNGSATQ
jgi:hypothetical protein